MQERTTIKEQLRRTVASTSAGTMNLPRASHHRALVAHSCTGLDRFGRGCLGFPAGSSDFGRVCWDAGGSSGPPCPGLTWARPCSASSGVSTGRVRVLNTESIAEQHCAKTTTCVWVCVTSYSSNRINLTSCFIDTRESKRISNAAPRASFFCRQKKL